MITPGEALVMKDSFKQDTYKDSIKVIGLSIGNLASKVVEDIARKVTGHRNKVKRAFLAYRGEDTKLTKNITITITKDN